MIPFINDTSLEFSDISSEQFRTYVFDNAEVTITEPTHLSVGLNGHRVFDAQGMSHYIPKGWIQLKWKAKVGSPNFVK